VIHISVHTFTPNLNGSERTFGVGMLYDPKRYREKLFCKECKECLEMGSTELSVRMNRPYKGTSDGFTTYLRNQFPEENYLGIELEVNQKFCEQGGESWEMVCREIADSLVGILAKGQ
jgi:predicted N-formylglutamate amidohydrolase